MATLLTSTEPVIAVVAPPGYGKTTLLAQWAAHLGPRVAWVSCDDTDNDPVALWSAVTTALSGIEPPAPAAAALLATSGGGVDVVPRLVSVLASIPAPVTVVLDHVESITSRESRTALTEFALRLPSGWRLALASRERLPIPIARLRANGGVVELGVDQLAMGSIEASSLLNGAGVELPDATTADLVQQTEGWPAGLYLAARAIRDGVPDVGFTFTGDDRLMADYLRSELLGRVSRAQASFLMQTSVLDRMCGPLCDAVVDGKDSARTLERLENRNLLVVPLDRRAEWYRYHNLMRELLQAELRRRDPSLIPTLHARAAAWFRSNGMAEAAIPHAQAAGDAAMVAALVLDLMPLVWASGRVETVLSWITWLNDRPEVRYYPAIAAHGALVLALLGKAGEAERWADVAERQRATGTLPDGSTEAATLAYLRAIRGRDGVDTMRRDARAGWEGLSPTSPYRATMLHTEGISFLLDGDPGRADAVLAYAFDVATGAGAASGPLAALVLAERFLVAVELNDWSAADAYARQALEIVDEGHLDGYWSSALPFAAAARSEVHRGQMAAAREHVRRAAQLRPLLTYALPVVSVQALLEMARVYIPLVDVAGARAVVHQAQGIMRQRPRLGNLAAAADRLQSRVTLIGGRATGLSALTEAELRLLPLLPTHLTFPEIGDRLFLSRHTIKTQAISLYRKLGVTSRGQAVARMSELGLHG